MASVRHLRDHPTARRWTALELVRIGAREGGYETGARGTEEGEYLPRFHVATFMQNLQREVGPVGKAHFYLTRGEEGGVGLTLLRAWVWDSPYAGQGRGGGDAKFMGLEGGGETIFVVFPDCTASVYVSVTSSPGLTSGGDAKSLRKFILEAIPKALSRPQERYTLKTTSLSARSLSALLAVRGPGRGNAAAGGWSIFAEGTVEGSPLWSVSTSSEPPKDDEEEEDELGVTPTSQSKKRRGWPSQGSSQSSKRLNGLGEPAAKRRKLVAKLRFGETALEDDQKGIDRLEIRIEDPFPAESTCESEEVDVATRAEVGPAVSRRGRRSTLSMFEESIDDDNDEADAPLTGWIPDIRLTFSGSHIFAGLRRLVESGAVDGEKMPGWMTGEASVSIGVVRGGRIRGNKGSGI
ncbi:Centromere protein Chl4/mis15/CENP-N [Lasallia pustulata]|uniref:Centromere protein Chl4/mis15/CENP-N n=1 Tax=Lasallia pustulata TaxID=136370 RepID=A0A1W5CX87_9LECA|nr:Centromere protein Chl4/mis15/CENP-N [Lasallia pustulata]